MSFVAVAVGGATLVGGIAGSVIQGNAASDAAKKQQEAAGQANSLQERMFNQQRDDHAGYRAAGNQALSQMADPNFQRDFTAADFQKDPGYDFRMAEGQKALERSAAARGGLNSGGTLRSLSRYGQDFASNEYGNAYNRFNQDRDRRFGRLSQIAGMGQGAVNSSAAAGQNYAGQYGNNTMGAANAAGAAGIAGANGWSNTLSGIGKMGTELYAMKSQPNWMNMQTNSLGGGSYTDSNFKMPTFGG